MKKMILLVLLFAVQAVATVSDGESIRQYFVCNGSTTTFTFTFKCNSSDDVLVYDHIIATGVETLLVEDTTYTIAATSSSYLNGGVVTISPALESTSRVVIVRNIKKSQETSSGAMSAAAAVLALDKLTRVVQDLQDRNDRSWHLQESDSTGFNMEIPGLEERAESYPYFGDDGTLTYVVGVTPDDVPVSSFMETVLDDSTAPLAMATLQGIPVFNVKNSAYGAVGDGVTDDSAAIQAAIDAATVGDGELTPGGGGIIFFPVGTYLCVSGITVNQRSIRFIGATPASSPWDVQTTGSVIKLGYTGDLFTILSNVISFENLYFDGNGFTGNLVRVGTGAKIVSTEFLRCTFHDGQSAIYATNSTDARMYYCSFVKCGTGTTIPGLKFFEGNEGGPFESAGHWQFDNCVWGTATGDSIQFIPADADPQIGTFTFINPKHEAEPGDGFTFLKGTVNAVQIFGGFIVNHDDADVINIIGDVHRFYGVHFIATTRAINITGNENLLDGCNIDLDDGATTSFLMTGVRNRAINCRTLPITAVPSFVGARSSDVASRSSMASLAAFPSASSTTDWLQGDIAFNYDADRGDPVGWICEVQGNPGKWRNFGNTITKTTEISSAQIKDLADTTIELVPSQGADEVIEFISAILTHNAGTAYVEPSAPDDLVIEWNTGQDVSASIDTTGFLTVTDDESRIIPRDTTAFPITTDLAALVNGNLRLFNTGSDLTTGTGTLTVKVTYRVHSLGL